MSQTILCGKNIVFLIIWFVQVFALVDLQNCPSDLIKLMESAIPPSFDGKTKGDAGRIGIIGGSIEYTGAPYFAAISALKVGADLVYVITTESAAPVIKSPGVILTPNHREAGFLLEAMKNQTSSWGEYVTVLVKGESDKYYSSNLDTLKWTLSGGGSGRRAAGQGDILSGMLGTLFNWALKANYSNCGEDVPTPNSIAAYSAAKLTRLCNAIGFSKYGRSMTASDMLRQIHHAFDDLFIVL